jgi:hypothetical protein
MPTAANDDALETDRLWRTFALVLHGDCHHTEWLQGRFDSPDHWLDEAEKALKPGGYRYDNLISAPKNHAQLKAYRYCWSVIRLIFADSSLVEIEEVLDNVVHEMGERGAPVG